MIIQPNMSFSHVSLIQNLLSRNIKQGTWPLKSFLHVLGTSSKNTRQDKREPPNTETDGQNWKGIGLDLSLATHRFPAQDCSKRPLEPTRGGTLKPGKRYIVKQDANVTAYLSRTLLESCTYAISPTTTGVSRQKQAALHQRNDKTQRYS